MKSIFGMNLQFKEVLTHDEQSFINREMKNGEIYLGNDNKYYSAFCEPKSALFMFAGIIQTKKPSILGKLQKLNIHYGEFEDDLIEEWKEKGIM